MRSTTLPPLSPSEPPRVFGAPILHTDGELLAVAIASDGTLWSIEEPGELRGWNLVNRQLVSSRPLESFSTLWSFNWAARLLGSASDEVTVWEVASGSQLTSWSTPCWITALAFQPGTTRLATGHDDGSVRVWDWTDSRLLFETAGNDSPISAVAFSFDQKLLACAGEDRDIHLWKIPTGQSAGTLRGHTDRIPALTWHPDGRRLFSAGWDTTVRVWDVEKGEPLILLNSHATQVHALALSGEGKLLATTDSRNDIHLWDIDRHQSVCVLRKAASEIRCLAFTPDDGRGNLPAPLLAMGSADRFIHLWDSRQGPMSAGGIDPQVFRTNIAIDPAGKRLYSLGAGTEVRVWDIGTSEKASSLEGDPIGQTFALSPNGKLVALSRSEASTKSEQGSLVLHDATTGKLVTTCEGQHAPITALGFSGDSNRLASGGVRSSDVWVWDTATGQPSLLLNEAVGDCSVEALAFQPGSDRLAVAGIDWLATSGEDGQVVVWDLDTRTKKAILKVTVQSPSAGPIRVKCGATALAFRPDGRILACATLNRMIRLWDLEADEVVGELVGHTETVNCLAFSPDGRWLASGSEDNTLRIWEAMTREQVGAWELDNPILALCYSPDGRFLYTGNGNTSCYQVEVERILAGE